MTKGGRKFAGIFSIIGSGLMILLAFVLIIITTSLTVTTVGVVIGFWFFIIVGALGLVGGILLLTDKAAGGILALVGGSIGLITFIILLEYMIGLFGIPPGYIWILIMLFFLPPGMILTGGIVGMAVGSEF